MSDDYDGRVNGEVVLNLADWIERRRDAVGPYADHIIHSVRAHETELARLRAEVERLTKDRDEAAATVELVNSNNLTLAAALSDERAHADAMAEALTTAGEALSSVCPEAVGEALRSHRARRQG